jgi:hypothetical protein
VVPVGEFAGVGSGAVAGAPSCGVADLGDGHELREVLAPGEHALGLLEEADGALEPAVRQVAARAVHPSLRLHFLAVALRLGIQARAPRTLHCPAPPPTRHLPSTTRP